MKRRMSPLLAPAVALAALAASLFPVGCRIWGPVATPDPRPTAKAPPARATSAMSPPATSAPADTGTNAPPPK